MRGLLSGLGAIALQKQCARPGWSGSDAVVAYDMPRNTSRGLKSAAPTDAPHPSKTTISTSHV
jgi:hypothetical protein